MNSALRRAAVLPLTMFFVCAATAAAGAPVLDTLDKALALVARAEAQTPLLVVDAPNTRPAHQRQVEESVLSIGNSSSFGGMALPPGGVVPTLTARPNGTLALRDVAAFFDRKIVPAGGVSALAPTTMIVLNARPGKGDGFTGLSRAQKLTLLLGTLSPSQWRLLGGEQGLGAGDLSTPTQQNLFLSLLPDPFVVRKPGPATAENQTRLTPGQRASVRLAAARRVTLYVPLAGGNPNDFRILQARDANGEDEQQRWTRVPDHQTRPVNTPRRNRTTAYGVTVRDEVRSAAKPGDLPLDSARLNAPISLNGAKTVGDLVRRAGETTKLELYADARWAGLSLTVLGDAQTPVRSGDALRALCLALSGTFRKVTAGGESAYVLTDDVRGVATRQRLIQTWMNRVGGEGLAQIAAVKKQIAAQRPEQYLRFRSDDPYALPDGLMETLETAAKANRRRVFDSGPGAGLSRSDLPPAFQQLLRDSENRQSEGVLRTGGDTRIRPGQVGVQVKTRLVYLVPGAGLIESDDDFRAGGDESLEGAWAPYFVLPPAAPEDAAGNARVNVARLPANVAARALLARAANPDEAAALAQAARTRGFNQLWLALPDAESAASAQTRALLDAALQAGKKNEVAIVAVVPLLRRRTGAAAASDEPGGIAEVNTPPDDALDRNVLGQTTGQEGRRRAASPLFEQGRGDAENELRRLREVVRRTPDLLRVDDAGVAARLKENLAALAATPGLAALVLEDTVAPGYQEPGTATDVSTRYDASGWGYTPALRLAFLREAGADPVDLTGENGVSGLDVPSFVGRRPEWKFIEGQGHIRDPATSKTPDQTWAAFRYNANRRFLADLHAILHGARPNLPIYLAERGSVAQFFTGWGGAFWYGLWERPDALPRFAPLAAEPGGPRQPEQQARQFSSRNLLRVSAPLDNNPVHLSWLAKSLLDMVKPWNGLVLDLRDLSADQVIALLDAAFAPAP